MVKLKQHRQIPKSSIIKSCTISKEPSNKYYISILVEQEIQRLEKTNKNLTVIH